MTARPGWERELRSASHGEWGNWIRARCPACFSRKSEVVERFGRGENESEPWRVVRCVDCAQMYTDPQPPFEAWESFYPEDYPAHQVHARRARWHTNWRRAWERWLLRLYRGYGLDSARSHQRRLVATALAPLLGRWLDPYILPPANKPEGEGKLLDFGCGSGNYLARMRALGWDVLGVDLSARAAGIARDAFQVPVVVGTIPSSALAPRSFDLVTAWEVLEHVQRPRQTLAGIRSLLRPGGRFVLTVPNQCGWGARFFGPDWYGLDLPRHLTHFTPSTLCAMLRAEKFHIVHQSTVSHSGWLRHSARQATDAPNGECPRGWRGYRVFRSHAVSSGLSRWARRRGMGESIYVVAAVR